MLAIGCDHAGFPLKNQLLTYLRENGYEIVDVGVFGDESADYPLIARAVAKKILSGECERGILVCGTGIGISIAANKVPGIRCALCADVYSARMTRAHNDANVIALGARTIGVGLAEEILDAFLKGSFEGGRHQRRVDLIENRED